MTTQTNGLWQSLYNKVGRTFRRPDFKKKGSKEDPKRPKYVTGWNNPSGFLMVSKVPRLPDVFRIEGKAFFSKNASVDFEFLVSGAELSVLADIPERDVNRNDPSFAAKYGAEFGLQGIFLRRGDEVIILLPTKRPDATPLLHIQAKDFFVRDMRRMIRFGRIDVKSSSE